MNLCIFKLCAAAPKAIQSHRTTVDDHVIFKRGIGLRNEDKKWLKLNEKVIVPWKASQKFRKKLKDQTLKLVTNEKIKKFQTIM